MFFNSICLHTLEQVPQALSNMAPSGDELKKLTDAMLGYVRAAQHWASTYSY
jgi:hypothetical protein